MGRRRRRAGHLEGEVILVAPPPLLARLVGADDGVIAVLLPVARRVAVRRVVATPDVATRHAHAQVHPAPADAEAVLAPRARWIHIGDGVEMRALLRHPSILSRRARTGAVDRERSCTRHFSS